MNDLINLMNPICLKKKCNQRKLQLVIKTTILQKIVFNILVKKKRKAILNFLIKIRYIQPGSRIQSSRMISNISVHPKLKFTYSHFVLTPHSSGTTLH